MTATDLTVKLFLKWENYFILFKKGLCCYIDKQHKDQQVEEKVGKTNTVEMRGI